MSETLKQHLNHETARAPWHELQRFFAAGQTLFVNQRLDLLDVASAVAEDDTQQIQAWIEQGDVGAVPDDLALAWFEADASVWTVVVLPWILVQSADAN